MKSKYSFDSKCLDLVEYFYPHWGKDWKDDLAQLIQESIEAHSDIDGSLPHPDRVQSGKSEVQK